VADLEVVYLWVDRVYVKAGLDNTTCEGDRSLDSLSYPVY